MNLLQVSWALWSAENCQPYHFPMAERRPSYTAQRGVAYMESSPSFGQAVSSTGHEFKTTPL